jgi:enterochelin esterase-like enzyme
MFKRTVGGIVLVFAGVLGGMLVYHWVDSARSEEEAQITEDFVRQQKLTPVKFVIHVPQNTPAGQPLFLSGSMPPFPWEPAGPPLSRQADGTYSTTLELMTGLAHEFKITRGTWSTVECNADDTDIPNRVLTPAGNDVIEVRVAAWRDKGVAIPGRLTYTGDIREHKKVSSGIAGMERNLTVYLPPGYDDAANADTRYPVLYLQDGQNLFDQSVSYNGIEWKVDEIAQQLISEGRIRPVIIVGIWNTPTRTAEYTPAALLAPGTDSLAQAYADLVVQTVKPLIDERYRTLPDAPHTAIGGGAMGGLAALSVAQQHPQVFGALALLTPQLRANGKPALDILGDGGALKDKRIYLDASPETGSAGQEPVQDAAALADLLARAGIDAGRLRFIRLGEPANNESAWQARFDQVLVWLYGERDAPPAPAAQP